MNFGDGDSDSSNDEDDDSPSLSNLVEKVNKRKGGNANGTTTTADDGDDGFVFGGSTGDTEPERPIAEFGSDPKTEALIEVIGDAANILLLGPLLCPADHDLCTKLTTGIAGDPDNLLLVTMTQSPDERLNAIRGYLGDLPTNTAVLNIGDSTRSGKRETIATDDDGQITIETISDPTDLMRIGIAISKTLSNWADSGGDTVVCFHSLTALLQFVDDPKVVFRFIHVLQGQIRAAGATAHYHMDSGAHDDQVIATFRPLFDEVLTYTEDGSLTVQH